MNKGLALTLPFFLFLTGCTIGPNYKRPSLMPTDGYGMPKGQDADPAEQRFALGQLPPRKWWTGFGSTALDDLVDQALLQNQTLQAANSRLKMANDDLRAENGALWPSLSVSRDQTQQRYSSVPGAPGTFYNVTTQSVSISYNFDLVGGERRAIEGKAAQADYARYERAAAYQSLGANLVTTALDVAMLKEQIEASRDIVASQRNLVSLVEAQEQAGSVGHGAVLSAEAALDARKADLNTLFDGLAQAQHRLARLTGRSPDEAIAVDWKLADLALPHDLPVSLPSDVVDQRPDIRAAEALLHEASANIGVADANRLPKITLSGNYAANVWYLTSGLAQPVFAGGSLNAERKGAIDAYDAARADYRSSILNAFQNIADVLSALDTDNKTYLSSNDRLADAKASLALTEDSFGAGTISRITLLTQTQALQEARINLLQAIYERYVDTVALYLALGGHDW